MLAASQVAAQAAIIAQKQMQVEAANLGNLENGAKVESLTFEEHAPNIISKPGAQVTDGAKIPLELRIGNGSKITGTVRNLSQGAIKITGNPLDLAIQATNAYFAVTAPNGRTGYTRNGAFLRDSETGALITMSGQFLANNIIIPENVNLSQITITNDGIITAPDPDNPREIIEIGEIELFRFANEQGLSREGNLFYESATSGEAAQIDDLTNKVKQKALEESNSSPIEVMMRLREAERLLDLALKIMQADQKAHEKISKIE